MKPYNCETCGKPQPEQDHCNACGKPVCESCGTASKDCSQVYCDSCYDELGIYQRDYNEDD